MNKPNSRIGLALLALAAIAACSKGSPATYGPDGEEVVLDVLSSDGLGTKTWLDTAGVGVKPVYWSNGDQICVNGVVSSELSVGPEEKLSKASFKVRNVEAPFSIVYPASDCVDFNDANGDYTVRIPAVQTYVPGSFSCGAAILYGTSQTEGEAVQLKNICGAIKLTLKDESAVIKSLVLTSLGDNPITGTFTLKPSAGTLEAVEGGKTVTLQLPDQGVSLTPAGTSFIITIPQGSYPDGFSLKFMDADKHILRSYWLRSAKGSAAGVEVAAGDIVIFEASDYDPDAREINSAADWEEFAAAYNSGTWQSDWLGKDGTIKISEDFSASSLTAIDDFADILDAGGHTLTQTAGNHPLFKTMSGTVRNLTLAGKITPSDPSDAGAAVFCTNLLDGGQFENCVNKANVNATSSSKTVAGAFARTMKGGVIKDCVNDGEIYVNVDVNEADQPVVAGGFVGTVSELMGKASIINCTNNASLKVIITKSASSARRPVNAGYGGIVGTVVSGDADKYLTLENCTNNAPVSATYSVAPTSSSALLSSAGGIVGAIVRYSSNGSTMWWWTRSKPASVESEDCVYAVLKNCTNYGKVNNDHASTCSSDDPYKCCAGGVVGTVNGLSNLHAVVDGCRNYGVVVAHEFKYSRSCYGCCAGGLAGIAAYADFTDCIVKSTQVGSSVRQNYSTSGAIAYAISGFKMKNCKIFADLVHIRVTNYTDMNYAMGFTLSTKLATQGGLYKAFVKLDGSEVTDCRFGGTVTYNSTAIDGNASSFKLDKKDVLSASNVDKYVASASFYVDAEKQGFPDQVKFENNTYWDGKE